MPIHSKMIRIKEFADAALNKSEGYNVIDEIQAAYSVSIDLDEEIERLKEVDFSE